MDVPRFPDPELEAELKAEANARGVPYQLLMRMFIIEGFKRLKRGDWQYWELLIAHRREHSNR